MIMMLQLMSSPLKLSSLSFMLFISQLLLLSLLFSDDAVLNRFYFVKLEITLRLVGIGRIYFFFFHSFNFTVKIKQSTGHWLKKAVVSTSDTAALFSCKKVKNWPQMTTALSLLSRAGKPRSGLWLLLASTTLKADVSPGKVDGRRQEILKRPKFIFKILKLILYKLFLNVTC